MSMRIPFWLLSFLPESVRDKSIGGRWDDKTDEQIIYAYKDNYNWDRMWKRLDDQDVVAKNAIKRGLDRYEKYIRPQMERRGLSVEPPTCGHGYEL